VNLGLFIRRMIGRPTLRLGIGSSVGPTAQILNAGGSSDKIRAGSHCRIEGELFVFAHGGEIQMGDWCFVGPGTRIWSSARVTIGNRVLISHNCNIMDSLTHPLDAESRHAQYRAILERGHPRSLSLDERPVAIGDDAWIGAAATVLRGISIGRGAIVGASSVVTRDVAPWTTVAGNPARVIRTLVPGMNGPVS
jgi:acetyltransferase-like isoleucine patch superfamily enzyme